MNIFFDMDYTLLGLDNTLRPGTREVLERLRDDGHTVYVWSGVGIRWKEVREHHLEDLVAGCYMKPLPTLSITSEEYLRKVQQTPERELPVKPDFVVDDYPEIPMALGGVWVQPYYFSNRNDHEMERVYAIITAYARNGHSDDERYKRRGTPRTM